MIRPDYKEFARLSRGATLVPVAKSISADLLTPVSAFLAVADGEPDAFLLESVEGGEKIGRYTFLGVRPFLRLESRGAEIRIERSRNKKVERRTGNVFERHQRTAAAASSSGDGRPAAVYRRRGRLLRV